MGRNPGHPSYQSRRDCESHAASHSHLTNTGAKVRGHDPLDMCLHGGIDVHPEAGAMSAFLVLPPDPGPSTASSIGVFITLIHPT